MLKDINRFSVLAPITIIFLLSGCSTTGNAPAVGPRDSNPNAAMLDQDVRRNSESFHSFILGELEIKKDNVPKAIEKFKRASELASTPSSEISSRLAALELRSGNLEKALIESAKAVSVDPQNASVLSLHAGILEALNRPTEAMHFYEQAAAADKDAVEPLLMQAAILLKDKKRKEAIGLMRSAIKKRPDAVPLYIFLARAYEETADYSNAAEQARKGFMLSKESPEVGLELVRILLKAHKFGDAKKLCNQILEKSPENSLARRVLAQLLVGENRPEEALHQLTLVEKTDGDPTQAQIGIALIELGRKNFKAAIDKLILVLAKSPHDAEIQYTLATAYAASGDFKRAQNFVEEIDSDKPQYEKSRIFLATMLRQQGHLDEAISTIEEVEDNVGFDPQLELYRASLYREQGDKKKVRDILENLFKKQEPNDRLLFDYAVVLHDLGDVPETITALRKAISLNSANVEALNFLAYEISQSSTSPDDLKQAQGFVKKASQLKPKDAYIMDTQAWVEFKLGNIKDAQKMISRALKIIPDDAVLLEHAAMIEKTAGDAERSKTLCETAAHLDPKDDEAKAALEQCHTLLIQ